MAATERGEQPGQPLVDALTGSAEQLLRAELADLDEVRKADANAREATQRAGIAPRARS